MNIQRIARILENKNHLIINEVVLSTAQREGQIIHGSRSFNLQSPTYLKKKTTDYDILTQKPRKSAREVARHLSRRTGKEFEVVKGLHKGTYRVKMNGEVVADYSQLKRRPKTKKVWGTEVRSLKSIKRDTQRMIREKKTEFRREKDIDTLQRIKKIERMEERFN